MQQWGGVAFIDEATIVYNPSQARRKVRMRHGEELCEKNLLPSLKSGRTNVGVFACIAKGSRTGLILLRRRAKSECTSSRDRLGLNASQFAREIHKPHVIPFIQGLCENPNHVYLVADGATWHGGLENQKLREECGYVQLPWPPNSPNLNPIENVWNHLKQKLSERFSEEQ